MNINFDFENVETTEFGVGRDEDDGRRFYLVPVDRHVKNILKEMAQATIVAMEGLAENPTKYEPSEKYESKEYLYLPLDDDLTQRINEIHSANNLSIFCNALNDTENLFCYFARFIDNQERRLTAIRRSTQFKGVVKERPRLIRLVDDTMELIEDTVFKLDMDFDLIIDNQNVLILRPKGFESIGELKEALLAAVPQNIQSIQQELNFVNLSTIQEYAMKHPRAAKYLVSIRSQGEMKNVDKEQLKDLCDKTGVKIDETEGMMTVDEKDIMGFLEVLDRRRYEVELVSGSPESYKASSRSKLGNMGRNQ